MNRGVLAARSILGFAARAGTTTRPTIIGAGVARLPGSADAVATVGATDALAAPKGLDFRGAGEIPRAFATPGIKTADARLDGRIATAEAIMRGTAITGTRAVATIHCADVAALVHRTLPVTAARDIAALPAAEVHYFLGADGIPLGLTAEGILLADTLGHRGVVTSGGTVALAAIASAGPAIARAELAVFPLPTLRIAARGLGVANTTPEVDNFRDAGLVPGSVAAKRVLGADACGNGGVGTTWRPIGKTAVARVVAVPAVLRTVAAGLSPGALTVAANRTGIAIATAILVHFVNALAVPTVGAAEGILLADARRNGRVVAAWGAVGLAAVTRIRAASAILGATGAALTTVAGPVAAHRRRVATAAPEILDLVHARLVPFGLAAIGIEPADALLDAGIIAARAAVGQATGGDGEGGDGGQKH